MEKTPVEQTGQRTAGGCRPRRCCESGDGTRRGAAAGKGSFVEPALLAALSVSGGHGYDLARAVEEMTAGEVVPDAGGLYRILRRLEDDGFVTSEWQEGDSGPQRRAYRITSDGRALLAHWVVHLEERRRALDVLLDVVRSVAPSAEAATSSGRQS
jgi:DNA-binding PadR family transcriptional regulator